MDSLLIVGNGFDIQCGLPSTFDDYFKHLKDNAEKSSYTWIYGFLDNLLDDSKNIEQTNRFFLQNQERIIYSFKNTLNKQDDFVPTFIELVFMYGRKFQQFEPEWAGLEKFLYDLVNEELTDISSGSKKQSIWQKAFSRMNVLCFLGNEKDIEQTIAYFGQRMSLRETYSNEKKWERFLIEQIELFEIRFDNYLTKVKADLSSYNENAHELYKRIIVKSEVNNLTYALSFNYTDSFHSLEKSNIENVHGTLGKGIIIGIDSTDIDYKKGYYCLSKTFKKIQSYTKNMEKHVRSIIHRKYDNLVFFGHSLNYQDYAYFQSLFDNNDIYNKCTLVFLYTIYEPTKETQIKETQISRIIELIETYGKNMDNKNNAKNLLHKLTSEGRLIIRKIEPL